MNLWQAWRYRCARRRLIRAGILMRSKCGTDAEEARAAAEFYVANYKDPRGAA